MNKGCNTKFSKSVISNISLTALRLLMTQTQLIPGSFLRVLTNLSAYTRFVIPDTFSGLSGLLCFFTCNWIITAVVVHLELISPCKVLSCTPRVFPQAKPHTGFSHVFQCDFLLHWPLLTNLTWRIFPVNNGVPTCICTSRIVTYHPLILFRQNF